MTRQSNEDLSLAEFSDFLHKSLTIMEALDNLCMTSVERARGRQHYRP